MNEDFEEYLRSNGVNDDALLEAFRSYVSEQAEYLPPEEMRVEMEKKAADAKEMGMLLQQLAHDKDSLLAAAHIVLGAAWGDSNRRTLIQDTISSTNKRMPVIETAIIAIVTMYAMYLITTGGIREIEKETRKGDKISKERIKYEPPTAPLKMVVNLFRSGGKAEKPSA